LRNQRSKAAATFVACYRKVGGLPLDADQARLYEEAISA